MKILGLEIKRVAKTTKEDNDLELKLVVEFVSQDLQSYETMHSITKIVAENVAKEIMPEIKERLLSTKGMATIVNEIILNLAKEIIK